MKLRELNFSDEQACINDLEALRKSCRAGGSWTLPQACWHINFPLEKTLTNTAPASEMPAEQQKKLLGFIEQVTTAGWPTGAPASKEMIPPIEVGPEAIDALIASLQTLSKYKAPQINAFIFGTLDTQKFKRFVITHAAHHLSHFAPEASK